MFVKVVHFLNYRTSEINWRIDFFGGGGEGGVDYDIEHSFY